MLNPGPNWIFYTFTLQLVQIQLYGKFKGCHHL